MKWVKASDRLPPAMSATIVGRRLSTEHGDSVFNIETLGNQIWIGNYTRWYDRQSCPEDFEWLDEKYNHPNVQAECEWDKERMETRLVLYRLIKQFENKSINTIEKKHIVNAMRIIMKYGNNAYALRNSNTKIMGLSYDPISIEEGFISCKSDEGLTVTLIDSLMAIASLLSGRNKTHPAVIEALKDLRGDKDISALLAQNTAKDKEKDELLVEAIDLIKYCSNYAIFIREYIDIERKFMETYGNYDVNISNRVSEILTRYTSLTSPNTITESKE